MGNLCNWSSKVKFIDTRGSKLTRKSLVKTIHLPPFILKGVNRMVVIQVSLSLFIVKYTSGSGWILYKHFTLTNTPGKYFRGGVFTIS